MSKKNQTQKAYMKKKENEYFILYESHCGRYQTIFDKDTWQISYRRSNGI